MHIQSPTAARSWRWSAGRVATVAAILVALVTTLAPSTQPALAADTDGDPDTGTVSGTVFHQLSFNNGRATDGRVVFVDMEAEELETEVLADGVGDYSVELPSGTYAVVFYNSSDGFEFEEFFPEVYREQPLFTLDPNLIEVTAGSTQTVDANLAPLFFDMFDSVFTEDIAFLRNIGVTKGCNPGEGNTHFCPEDSVTRGQMAAFLVRYFGLTAIDDGVDFEDIDGSIFHDDIRRLAAAGITKGCNPAEGNTRFCPKDVVSREEMAAFLVRAFNMKQLEDDFEDIDGSIFHDDIRRLATAGVTKGCNPGDGNTRFCPGDPVTRGEMAAFLRRALEWEITNSGA